MRSSFLVVGLSALLLAGCGETETVQQTPVRAVKLFSVSEAAGGNTRKFSGTLEAADSANMSFPVAGTITEVKVDAGDSVKKGDVIAELDKEPFELDVSAAKAELDKSRAAAQEKKNEFDRNKQLFEKGWVSKAALEQAQFAYETARGDVSIKNTRLNQEKRSLSDATLLAPFDGAIGERFVDANEEVSAGKEIVSLNASGALEVLISVPEQVISKLTQGMRAEATFSALPGQILQGRITEVSRVAGSGNIFPVKVSLDNSPSTLRAGMSGEVSLTTQDGELESGYLIPLSALRATESLSEVYVFVFDDETKTVKKKSVVAETARGNLIAVKGLSAGDEVVSAGVSFLSDGQQVKRMAPPVI